LSAKEKQARKGKKALTTTWGTKRELSWDKTESVKQKQEPLECKSPNSQPLVYVFISAKHFIFKVLFFN